MPSTPFMIGLLLMLVVVLPMIGWGLISLISGGSSETPPETPPPAHGHDRRPQGR